MPITSRSPSVFCDLLNCNSELNCTMLPLPLSSTRTASIRKSDTSVLEDLKALSWKTCQEGSLLNLSDHSKYEHVGPKFSEWRIEEKITSNSRKSEIKMKLSNLVIQVSKIEFLQKHKYKFLDKEAQRVPTEISADTSDKMSMIAILTDLQTKLDGHAKDNQEICLVNENLKNELLQCKQEICRLDTQKVKLDLENKVRQEQALVIQRNKRNAELEQENVLLKSALSVKDKSITLLQSEKEKILSEKKGLADSYLDEIKTIKATDDLHKDILGTRNPGLGYMAKRAQPVLYDADTLLHPTHHPVSIWDSEELDLPSKILDLHAIGNSTKVVVYTALETDRIQLKDTITSLRIQLDGLKVENVSLKRRYDELSKANTHSRTAYTEKLSALTTQHTKLQAQVTGKTSSGPSTSETPKVLAPGMYNLGSKYIPPPKRANWVKTTPLPKKKQVPKGSLVVQIVLWYLDSGCSRHMTGDRARLINFVEKFIGTVRFGNDEYAAIVGYGDYKLGQFCDGGLEVAFRQHSCHIRNYDMVDLLNGSRTTNLYSISLNDMMSASPLGKSKKASHPLKTTNTNTEVLHTLHMDLCGPMRSESINKKKYVLVIVDDYTRFGWIWTEFINKTLDEWFESVGISHETSVPRSPQQNGVVDRRTELLMEDTRLLALLCESSTGKKPNLQYFRVFGSLCYPTNDYDDVGKLKAKADIGLTSVQTSSGLAPQQMTSVTNSTELELTALQSGRSRSELVKDPEPPSVPPTKKQVDDLFQWFDDDEVIPPPAVPIPPVNAHAAQAPENAIGSPSTTVISEGAPAVTESRWPHQIPLPDTSDSDIETLFDHVDSNVFDTYTAPETDSAASSSNTVNIDVTPNNQLPHVQKWTQAHSLENIIGDKDRPVSTRKQLETDAMWCFFNEFLTHVEPKTYKQAHIFLSIPIKWIFKIKLMHMETSEEQSFEGFLDPEQPMHVYRTQERSLWALKQSSTCVDYKFLKVPEDFSTTKYAQEILKKFGFDTCTPIDTPMAERPDLDEDKGGKLIDPTRFRGMVGSLMDQLKPTEMHLTAIKRIFRYLKGTIHMGLWYPKDSGFELKAFADADYAGCHDTRRSTSGSAQFLGHRLVSWSSKKQKRIKYQLADIFTKALPRERFATLLPLLGVKQMSPETLKELLDESVSEL
ncbi:integrase, catalytic region, zinc finger, CCHC-type containing protein [Tanacetum coccineum]